MPRPGSPQPICACSALQRQVGFPVRQEPLLLGMLPAGPGMCPSPEVTGWGHRGGPQGEGAQAQPLPLTLMGFFCPLPGNFPCRPHLSAPFAPPPAAQAATHLRRVG